MRRINWIITAAVGAIATILFFSSVADYAFPGESARLMAAWQGLDLLSKVEHPLMAAIARPLGGGNAIAPICGILASMLLYMIVSTMVQWRCRVPDAKAVSHKLANIAGITTAVVFMLTPAVRSAATHLEPRLFDFTWILLTLAMGFPYSRMPKGVAWLFPFLIGAMTGLGLCESGLAVALMPGIIAVVTYVELQSDRKPYLALFDFVLATIVTFFVFVNVFDIGFADAIKHISTDVKGYYKTPGWLFVAIFSTLPFVTSIFSSNKAYNEKPGLVQWIFHCAMTFVAILAIATPLSPSTLLEPYAILPVTSSAFAAVLAGYLVSYWWYRRQKVVSLVSGGLLLFVLVVTALWNLFAFDGNNGAFADKVAKRVLADLGSRKWFVTDGTLDSHILLAARETGQEIHLIDLSRDLDDDYLARLGELVREKGLGGSKNGELTLSLTLGVLPFVQDWFSGDPSVIKDVAIWGAPDLWYSAGITPVPEFFFFGADPKRQTDWTAWKEFDAILSVPKGWGSYRNRMATSPVDRLRHSLRRHLGMVANNRGVWLQDQGRNDEAFAMYDRVLTEIDNDNICAVFNEVGMAGAKHPRALAKQRELERMLKAAVDDKERRYLLWRLGSYYGYIRDPEVFIRLGHTWARSGRPGDALSQIRRAIDFIPTEKRAALMNMMAMLYANEHDQKKSRAIYEQLLTKNANDHNALVGLMRLELLNGNSAKALEYLQKAANSSEKGSRTANMELAMVAMMRNDHDGAKKLLKKITDANSNDEQAWSLIAAVTMQQIDSVKDKKQKDALEKELRNTIMPAIEKLSGGEQNYYLQSTRGFMMLRQGEKKRREARDAFLAAAKLRPDANITHDLVLGLDISLDDKAGAETHARDVLRRNRNAPLANYIMGSLALGRGNLREAETYLRKAVSGEKPVELALNDLAEVLRRTKKLEEAELYARKAVKAAPGLYVAWETLGSILMDRNTGLDEAEACIRKACELSREKNGREADIRMLVSLARIQLKNGDHKRAKVTIRKVQARIGELESFEKQEFEELKKVAR